MAYPRTFSHIGISVPDLEAAVTFYTEVLGWYLIMQPTTIEEDDSAIGDMCSDVFGPGWGSFRIAHLSTGDRIGVELFQFPQQQTPEDNFEYWKTGIFHFCVQDPDVERLGRENCRRRRQKAHAKTALLLSRRKTLSHDLHGRSVWQHPRNL